jgi:hypothetical protein
MDRSFEMKNKQPNVNNNQTKWSTNENLCNSYRGLSVSSNSFLLAVGAILVSNNLHWGLMLGLFALAMTCMWYIFFRIIYIRNIITDYYKFELVLYFNNNGEKLFRNDNQLQESTYVRKRGIRKKVNNLITKGNIPSWDYNEKFGNLRTTRLKLDLILPALYSVIWVIIVSYSFIQSA